MGGQDKGWPRGPLTDTAPGAVRFPTREEILADSRVSAWHGIDSMPLDRTVIIARRPHSEGEAKRFSLLMTRVEPGTFRKGDKPCLGAWYATHWREDTVGIPVT